jgi:hypothetical protein
MEATRSAHFRLGPIKSGICIRQESMLFVGYEPRLAGVD